MIENPPLIRVAYAEDQTAVRESITRYLDSDPGIRVVMQGADGSDLLEKMLVAARLPDSCLIDIHMPLMNGFTLLKEIRRRWPAMPCIILSSFSNEYYTYEAIRLRANAYLTKSCSAAEIIGAVKAVFRGAYYYNEIIRPETIEAQQDINYRSLRLNEREIQLLKDSCSDLSYAAIAKKWGTTYKTIDGIRERLGVKLQVKSRAGLMLVAIKLGYFTMESVKAFG